MRITRLLLFADWPERQRQHFNEDDISDLKKQSKGSKFEIYDLRKQFLYLETTRENVKFFEIDEVVPASEVDSPPVDTRDLVFKFLENKLRIENARGRIVFQRVHRLGRPNNQFGSMPVLEEAVTS